MSHFSLLVIGDDVETQLEPFDENTQVEPYLDGDINTSFAEAVEYYTRDPESSDYKPELAGKTLDEVPEAELIELLNDWDGATYQKDENGKLARYSQYNPDSKWDWYSTGGRWAGFFAVKKDAPESEYQLSASHWSEKDSPSDKTGLTDSTFKRNIDFDLMRREAEIKALQAWEAFEKATKYLTSPGSWRSFAGAIVGDLWDYTQEMTDEQRAKREVLLDQARKQFNEDPFTQAVRKQVSIFEDAHTYFKLDAEDPKEAFIQEAIDSVGSTYAVLYQGEWLARGEMGWFGVSNDQVSEDDWHAKVRELVDSLPDDTLLTLIDVHI